MDSKWTQSPQNFSGLNSDPILFLCHAHSAVTQYPLSEDLGGKMGDFSFVFTEIASG